jgi:hypothetical protein
MEEECHADIIGSAQEFLHDAGFFPVAALDPDIINIKKSSEAISDTITQFELSPPTRVSALIRAIEIELSSSELFFQFALDLPFKSTALETLRKMVGENKNHILKMLERLKMITG